ncbi:MAG: nucleoside kinase [Lachnospiraceae bacterium]|nr:nucleoside kinase [Lachnospiraceae bacterium]
MNKEKIAPGEQVSSAHSAAYERSLLLLFLKAFSDETGETGNVSCLFSVRRGLYLEVHGMEVTEDLLARVKVRMESLVSADVPIHSTKMRLADARALFRAQGMQDKDRLFRFRRVSSVNVYDLGGYVDYFYGPMFSHTGATPVFDLKPYGKGILLLVPDRSDMSRVAPFRDQPKVHQALLEAEAWNRRMGVETVAGLNETICSGGLSDLILVQEALQEHKIAQIAREIADRPDVRFVMIAGPSSSGKTTFSHRLSIQLRALGLSPHPIPVDDYFVDRSRTPRDASGEYDFEALECVDLVRFNQDMLALMRGEAVHLPRYNFIEGKSSPRPEAMQLGEKDIIVIEGIHALNDAMSYDLPGESKYKIYISALTTLNIDEHNRIPTTDGRLIRRMTRDFAHRGYSGQATIRRWPSVRRGEERNIFPFQEDADVVFNSALVYELAVLKSLTEPILFQVPEDCPEAEEAKRLLKFFDYFLPVGREEVPTNSVLREFIGGGCFKV